MAVTIEEFRALQDEMRFGPVTFRFEIGAHRIDRSLVSNVHLVPFTPSGCLVVQADDGHWMMPGGTLEPGETWEEAARRELREEAGARVLDVVPMGVFECTASGPPYRRHLPWPRFQWVLGWAEVELVGTPTNPPGGERVVDVVCESARAVAERVDEAFVGDLYLLADRLRANTCCRPR